MYEPEKLGLSENTPIGYRYSDDDGQTWSEVRIIRPKNDPDFRGNVRYAYDGKPIRAPGCSDPTRPIGLTNP